MCNTIMTGRVVTDCRQIAQVCLNYKWPCITWGQPQSEALWKVWIEWGHLICLHLICLLWVNCHSNQGELLPFFTVWSVDVWEKCICTIICAWMPNSIQYKFHFMFINEDNILLFFVNANWHAFKDPLLCCVFPWFSSAPSSEAMGGQVA